MLPSARGESRCVAQIVSRMTVATKDARRKLRNQILNFSIFHEIDEQEAEHVLSLNSYHKEGTGDAD
jgi:hypothetical protein